MTHLYENVVIKPVNLYTNLHIKNNFKWEKYLILGLILLENFRHYLPLFSTLIVFQILGLSLLATPWMRRPRLPLEGFPLIGHSGCDTPLPIPISPSLSTACVLIYFFFSENCKFFNHSFDSPSFVFRLSESLLNSTTL